MIPRLIRWGIPCWLGLVMFLAIPALSTASSLGGNTWPCGIVPYEFVPNPQNPTLDPNLNPALAVYFQNAAAVWEQVAGVQFVRFDPQSALPQNLLQVSFVPPLTNRTANSINENSPTNAHTNGVGFPGGQIRQAVLWVDDLVGTNLFVNVHELGHVLGLMHEHQRPDRDSFISVDPSVGTSNANYLKLQSSFYETQYDFGSVMQYGIGVPLLPASTNPTLVLTAAGQALLTQEGLSVGAVGQYAGLSVTGFDAAGMAVMYPVAALSTCQLSVAPMSATIDLTSGNLTVQLTAQAAGQQAQTIQPGGLSPTDFIWSVDNQAIATVDPSGNVTAVGAGTANVTTTLIAVPSLSALVPVTVSCSSIGCGSMPPPTNPSCWNPTTIGWLWNCPGQPPPGGGSPPQQGCWHWDPTVGSAGGFVYDVCGGNPSGRNPNPPITGTGVVAQAGDPNDKQGASGVGVSQFLSGNELLRYAVLFGNVPTATAPAAEVLITDVLNTSSVDVKTLKLGPISFGTHIFNIPAVELASTGSYTTNFDLRPTENLGVRVTVALDSTTGTLSWTLVTVDPTTGMPPTNPLAGFLAPGEEGNVLFSIAQNPGIATNTQITNQAAIVFDANAPMNTPVWANTIDGTPPVSAVSALPASEPPTGFTVSWSGTDVGSGIRDFTIYVSDNGGPFTGWLQNTTSTSATFTGQVGHSYGFYSIARDLVDNIEVSKSAAEATTQVTLVLDTTPPVSSASVSPSPNGNGWNNTNVNVTLNSTDSGLGASGVKQIAYSTAGAQSIGSTVMPGASASFTISTQGITTVTYFGTDNAGNVETPKTVIVQIDETPPSILGSHTPPPNANGWNNSNVTVSFTCADSLSGLAAGSPPIPTVLSTESAGQSVSGVCQDLAGNIAGATVSGINIDKTSPVPAISAPISGATYTANQLVNAAFACTDGLSGVLTCIGTDPNGSKIDTSPNGVSTPKTFNVTSTDKAGNLASQSVNYLISCHYVALGINPLTVSRGGFVTFTGSVKSCTNSAQTITVKFDLIGPLGPKSCASTDTVMFTTPPLTIPAGTSKSISFPFLIPKTACAGTFTARTTTLIGGIQADSTLTTLTVK